MIAIWRSLLAGLCLRAEGVSFRPQEALGDLTRRVDSAVKTAPATTEGAPPTDETFRPVHQDEAVLEAEVAKLPPQAGQVVRDLEAAVQRIETKLAQGQSIAANDPDLLAYKARAAELTKMLAPVDLKAAKETAEAVRGATGTQALTLLREASDNPAQLQAVLKQLGDQGCDYLKLFKKMDGPAQEQQLLALTAPAMSAQQKAEAISLFADGITPEPQEQAMAALLASEATPAGREGLLRQLAGRGIDYARVAGELGDKGRQAEFQNNYLQVADYDKLRAAGVALGSSATGPSPETAAARAAATRRGEADAPMLTDARARPEADVELAGRAAPAGTPNEVAKGNQDLLGELRGRLADNKQQGDRLGAAAKEIDGQIAGLDAATTKLLDRKRLLEGLLAQHDAPELRAALAGVERDLGELKGVRETLAKEKMALVGAQGGLTRSNTGLETRAQQAIKEAIGAVRQGVDVEVKAQVIDMAEGLLAENTAAREPLPASASYEDRVAHLAKLGGQLESLQAEGELLIEARDGAPAGKPPAPPDPSDQAAVDAYAARLKAEKSAAAVKDGKLVDRTTEAYLSTADQVQAELTEVGKAINERAMDQAGETLTCNQASFALLGKHAEVFQKSAQTHRTDDVIQANDAARDLIPKLKAQIGANNKRIDELEQSRDKALKDLEGLVPPELIAKLRKNELSEQERDTLLAALPGARDLGKHVQALEAITTLRTVDNQITSLQETNGKLKEHRKALKDLNASTTEALEGLRTQFNEYLAATGGSPIKDVSYKEMKRGLEELADKMMGPATGKRDVFAAPTLMQINVAADARKIMLNQLLVPTLRDAFGYTSKDLQGIDISLAGTRKAVSALRQELGLPDNPPGELTTQEAEQLAAIMSPQGLKGEKTPLVERMLTRRLEMQSFGGEHADVIRDLMPRIQGADGKVGMKEIAAALADPSLSHIQQQALLRLVTPRDGAGKIQPNPLFRYMCGEGKDRFDLGGIQEAKGLAGAADQHLNIDNVRDMRSRAKELHAALDQDDWWSSPDAGKIFDSLEWRDKEKKIPMTQADIASLALEYKKQHPDKDLFGVLQTALSTRDKGRAMFAADSRTLQDRVEDFRPESAVRAMINDPKAREKLAAQNGSLKFGTAEQRKQSVAELDAIADCDRRLKEMGIDPAQITSADQAFYEVQPGDTKGQALQALLQEREGHVQRMVEIRSVAGAVRYLQKDVATADTWKKCGSDSSWLTAAFDPGAYRDMDTAPIKQAGKDAMAVYGRYQAAAEPTAAQATQDIAVNRQIARLEAERARNPEKEAALSAEIDSQVAKLSPKAKLYREFIVATATAQQTLDRGLAQERTANEDYIQRLETAIKVTKTVAVVSAATVVTIATFGTGTAAVAAGGLGYGTVTAGTMAVAAGTLTGTAMGVGLDAVARASGYQELDEKGNPIKDDDFLKHSIYGNMKTAFVTSLSTVTGLGFAKVGAQLGGFAQTAAEGTWIARQGGQLLIQAGVGGVTNVTLDTFGRAVEGQSPDAKRMAFAFFQGAVTAGLAGATHSIGTVAGVARDAAVGVAGEYLYAKGVEHRAPSMDEMVQNAFQQVIVGGLASKGNKFIEQLMVGATGKGMAQGAGVRDLLNARAGQKAPPVAPPVVPHAATEVPTGPKEVAAPPVQPVEAPPAVPPREAVPAKPQTVREAITQAGNAYESQVKEVGNKAFQAGVDAGLTKTQAQERGAGAREVFEKVFADSVTGKDIKGEHIAGQPAEEAMKAAQHMSEEYQKLRAAGADHDAAMINLGLKEPPPVKGKTGEDKEVKDAASGKEEPVVPAKEEPVAPVKPPAAELPEIATGRKLPPEQAQAILKEAQIPLDADGGTSITGPDGQPQSVAGIPIVAQGGERLTPQFLADKDLGPKYTVKVGDQEVHLSKPYDAGQGRQAVVAYVKNPVTGATEVHTFYRSNSQGSWRSASHAGIDGWVGKGLKEFAAPRDMVVDGYVVEKGGTMKSFVATRDMTITSKEFGTRTFKAGETVPEFTAPRKMELNGVPCKQGERVPVNLEESTNLPVALQKSLTELSESQPPMQLGEQDRATAFYGGLRTDAPGSHAPELGAQVKEVKQIGRFTEFNADGSGKPGSFVFDDPAMAPDFAAIKPGAQPAYQVKNLPMHGDVDAFVVPSKNGELQYLFYRNKEGQTWVAGVEDAAGGINSFGTGRNVIMAGDLAMPAKEYGSQIPTGYAGEQVPGTEYRDASKYVNELPVIKDFNAALEGRLPAQDAGPLPPGSKPQPPGARPETPPGATAAPGDLPSGTRLKVQRTGGEVQNDWQVAATLRDGRVLAVKDGTTARRNAPTELLAQNPETFKPGQKLQVRQADGTVREMPILAVDPATGQVMMGTKSPGGRFEGKIVALADLLEANPGLELQVKRSNGDVEKHRVAGVTADGEVMTIRGPGKLMPRDEVTALNPELAAREAAPVRAAVPSQEPKPVPGVPGAKELPAAQAAEVLAKAQVPQSAIRALGVADATPQFLAEKGLGPKYTVTVGGQEVHLSAPYDLGGGRQAFVAYVPDGKGGVQVRAFYRSNSQGLWRSASNAGPNGWIGKGIKEFTAPQDMVFQGKPYKQGETIKANMEESTNLPISLQQELGALSEKAPPATVSGDDAQRAFYGSLKVEATPTGMGQQIREVTTLGDFAETVPGTGGKTYGKPGTFRWHNEGDKPSFGALKPGDPPAFQVDHPIHGKLDAYVVPSENGTYNYMFFKDKNGKTWLGAVERADAGITSFGGKDRVVLPGDMTMPAMEYDSQVPKSVADQGKQVTGSYVDASDYVHQLDVVKDFRAALLGEVPAPPPPPLQLANLADVRVIRGVKDGLNVEEAGWKVNGVTEEGNVQVVKDLGNGQMMVKEYSPSDFLRLNPQPGIADADAFVRAGGLNDLPRVNKAQHVDARAGATAALGDGRVAVNRQHLDQLADTRLGEMQATRPADFVKYREIIAAATPTERIVLRRALAAGYDVRDIGGLATDLKSLRTGSYGALGITDPTWVRYLNSITPDQRVLVMTTLEGHQQAFTTSCNPTSAQIVRGEVDPIFAMQGRINPGELIAEQQRLLQDHGGIAVLKTPGATGGRGVWPHDIAAELNNRLGMDRLGLEYQARVDQPGSPRGRAEMVLQLEKALSNGPTEIFVEWRDAAGKAHGAHAIAVLESRINPDGSKEFLLHDPEHTGRATWVSAKNLAEGNLGPTYPPGMSGTLYGFLDVKKITPR